MKSSRRRFSSPITTDSRRPWTRHLLNLSGIPNRHIHVAAVPLRIRSLIVPFSSFQVSSKIYKCHERFHRNVVHSFRAEGRFEAPAGNFYLSRSRLPETLRKITNEAELEALLERAGYRIVHPELLDVRT